VPAQERSLLLTDRYRDRLAGIVRRQEAFARRFWPADISVFDQEAEAWRESVAQNLATGQREAVRASAGYLSAFISSELGQRTTARTFDSRIYAGKSRDGRSLTESLRSPVIGTLAALKAGLGPEEALKAGLNRAVRMVEVDLMHAARSSLNDAMESDERVEGWQRAVRGTCGACMGDIAVEVSVQLPSIPLHVHPNCQCVTQPVVVGALDRFPLLTGEQRFERMSRQEQDEALGPAAEKIRAGEVSLASLVAESEMATGENFITQRPTQEVDDGR
jgi:hypothetical protein